MTYRERKMVSVAFILAAICTGLLAWRVWQPWTM
tara:strand:- start:188 stop:289 length:102 start_codon:yes stop_codon:yes gene_type:complete